MVKSRLVLLALVVASSSILIMTASSQDITSNNIDQGSGRLGTTPVVDLDSVYTGTWDPSNIAIHVSQNAFNFFVSSAGWLVASFFYNAPSKKRSYQTTWSDGVYYKKRSIDEAEEKVKISGKKIAAVLRTFAETAENLDKIFQDEL